MHRLWLSLEEPDKQHVQSVLTVSCSPKQRWFLSLFLCQWFTFTLSDPNDLARATLETSRLARAQAFDAHLHKQPSTGPAPIHTTAGLLAARVNNTPTGDAKIFITVECHLKSSMKWEQKSTSEDYGRWGKPWSKETYLSGSPFLYQLILSISDAIIHKGSWQFFDNIELPVVEVI